MDENPAADADFKALRRLLLAIAELATLPLPLQQDWDGYHRAAAMRLNQIRHAARTAASASLPAVLELATRTLTDMMAAGYGYAPDPGTMPKEAAVALQYGTSYGAVVVTAIDYDQADLELDLELPPRERIPRWPAPTVDENAAVVAFIVKAREAGHDVGEYVCHRLAEAAAQFGSVEDLMVNRPGSWEAAGVKDLILNTVGYGPDDLAQWAGAGMGKDRGDEVVDAAEAARVERATLREAARAYKAGELPSFLENREENK